jgi:hypothetical protein
MLVGNAGGTYTLTATSALGIAGSSSETDPVWLAASTSFYKLSDWFATTSKSNLTVGYATQLAANPTDCSVGQAATAIDASGNLTCSAFSSSIDQLGQIGDVSTTTLAWGSILRYGATEWESVATSTLGILTTNVTEGTNLYWTQARFDTALLSSTSIPSLTAGKATALASNPSDCSANQFANAIAANGNLTCSALADADIPDNITASNYLALTTWFATTTHSLISSLPSLATIGNITTGTWNGTAIGATKGGTGLTAFTNGSLLYASAANTWAALASSTLGTILQISATGYPSWVASTSVYTNAFSDLTWTSHNSYPTACSAGQYVSQIGDTLTCGTPTDTNTTYTAGTGLNLYGTQFVVATSSTGGYVLQTGYNGALAWVATSTLGISGGGGSGVPGGDNTQIQYNDSGSFAGSSNFIWDNDSKTLNFGVGSDIQIQTGSVASSSLSVDGDLNTDQLYVGSGSIVYNDSYQIVGPNILFSGSNLTGYKDEEESEIIGGYVQINGGGIEIDDANNFMGNSGGYVKIDAGSTEDSNSIAYGSSIRATQGYYDYDNEIWMGGSVQLWNGSAYSNVGSTTQNGMINFVDSVTENYVAFNIDNRTISTELTFPDWSGEILVSSSTSLYLDETGNVGIGTTSGNYLLTVGGTTGSNFFVDNAGGVQWTNATTTNNFTVGTGLNSDSILELDYGMTPYWSVGLDYSDSGNFKISTSTDFTTGNILVINKATGYLGIGSTTPGNTLDVGGTVMSNVFKAISSTVASVFNKLQVLVSLIIPIDKYLDTQGQIAIDTTTGQLRSHTGTATTTYSAYQFPSFTYATSTTWTGTTTIPLGTAYQAETWSNVQCFTDAGFLNVQFGDGTNKMNLILGASTTVGTLGLSTNNTFTAGEKRYVDIGTSTTATTKQISCTIKKSLDAD